ncbi:hypothetical protein BDB01DRAFT_840369 [Pilobolus umbonatus]|nr:hypothetical protein BDB01DRAFT_840369 [Pilobolus umbonatus]
MANTLWNLILTQTHPEDEIILKKKGRKIPTDAGLVMWRMSLSSINRLSTVDRFIGTTVILTGDTVILTGATVIFTGATVIFTGNTMIFPDTMDLNLDMNLLPDI